jgi:hypothetical protein
MKKLAHVPFIFQTKYLQYVLLPEPVFVNV